MAVLENEVLMDVGQGWNEDHSRENLSSPWIRMVVMVVTVTVVMMMVGKEEEVGRRRRWKRRRSTSSNVRRALSTMRH